MDSFSKYLKEQLKGYIKKEHEQGKPYEKIEKELLDFGHDLNVIKEAFAELRKEETGIEKDLDASLTDEKADILKDLKAKIKAFFAQMQEVKEKGARQKADDIESQKIIKTAVKEVKAEEKKYLIEGFFFFLYLLLLGVGVLFVAGATENNPVTIIIGLSAAFINAFVSFALIKFSSQVPLYMLIPFIIGTIFYVLGRFSQVPLFQGMEIEALGIINVVLGMFFNILMINIVMIKPKKKKRKQRVQKKEMNKEIEEDMKKPEKEHIDDLRKTFGFMDLDGEKEMVKIKKDLQEIR